MTSPPSVLVGIETGGTKIVCRVIDETGRTLTETRFPTVTPERVVDTLVATIQAALPVGAQIGGVGVASFGPVIVDPASPDFGRMLATPKAGWTGFNLMRALETRLKAAVVIDTDVNAAALAEHALGAGRGFHSVAYVTIGTGIGGGLVMDGRTLKGGLHPEIGHLPVRRAKGDAHPSTCRFHRDCVEGLTAGPALAVRLGGRRLDETPEVRAIVCDYLGQLAASLLLAWSPQKIIMGGGVMSTPELLPEIEARMKLELNDYGASAVAESSPYIIAAALEHAGLEGALIMARTASQSDPGKIRS
ncbi:ROK family protein [Brevundimonas intermedia]|uniref:ROK family protein n=1 Tax=Brevundimonas intermedia TaxID=74315 RepID=A0A4Y9RTY2_9CAUL|nr:ROK family protein [Brevundimonas intermedia]TFW11019.1 ROK family protein [Brevundimonas intermedia]